MTKMCVLQQMHTKAVTMYIFNTKICCHSITISSTVHTEVKGGANKIMAVVSNHLSHVMKNPTMWFSNRSDANGAVKHRRWLETGNFGFRKKRHCTIHVAKTKALISFAVTAKLICAFVFAYAKCWLSHDEAHFCIKIN